MLIGTARVEELAARAPVLARLDAEPVVLPETESLQVAYEIASVHREAMLPPALHPTDPAIVTWVVTRCAASPWGPFAMAETRLECRSGLRFRAFVVGTVIDSPAAASALRDAFAFPAQPGEVVLRRGYDAIDAAVSVGGRPVLAVTVADPDPLAPADIQHVANLHLAHTPRGLRLVQVEPRFDTRRAERGRPRVTTFEGAVWGEARIVPVHPVSASLSVGSIAIPRLRYLCRPDVLAFEGTEPVAEGG
jgi:Acetoacetate decarboxylase (ADC)